MIGVQGDTFVVKPGSGRVVIQTLGLVFCAGVFLSLAAFAVFAAVWETDSAIGRPALLVLAAVLVVFAVFILLFLSANWVRIEVGPQMLRLRLPRLRGPVPLPSLVRAEIAYSDIAAVEHREEMYSSLGLANIQDAYSLVLRDGTRILLGVLAELWGASLPVDQAAERIAQRAGCSVRDRGAVRVGGVIRGFIRDAPPWGSETMTAAERKRWHAHALRSIRMLGILLALMALARACAR
jgi:hypothetical protein